MSRAVNSTRTVTYYSSGRIKSLIEPNGTVTKYYPNGSIKSLVRPGFVTIHNSNSSIQSSINIGNVNTINVGDNYMQINGVTITQTVSGTAKQLVLNRERRLSTSIHHNFDPVLNAIQLGNGYVTCVNNIIYSVEPSGIFIRHHIQSSIKTIIYPNGDSVDVAPDGTTRPVIVADDLPDHLCKEFAEKAIRSLLFSPMTTSQYLASKQLEYSERSIDKLAKLINQHIYIINKWYIECTSVILDAHLKNMYIVRLVVDDHAKKLVQFTSDTISSIVEQSMREIAKLL